MKKLIYITAIFAIGLSACKKDPVETHADDHTHSATTGSISLNFEHMVDTNALVLNTSTYVNANNDTFKVSMFKYYISNIKFTDSNGNTFSEPNSYHLVDEATTSTKTITVANVPFANYTSVSFIIGVDSAHNVSGAQTGDLDPSKGMFWTWSSGYIMAKMEGTSPQSTATNNALKFHVGGYSGANNTIKSVSPSFGSAVAGVSSTVNPEIHLKVDLAEWFKTPNIINFATLNTVHMPGASAKQIADNYADMISVEHIHNDSH